MNWSSFRLVAMSVEWCILNINDLTQRQVEDDKIRPTWSVCLTKLYLK